MLPPKEMSHRRCPMVATTAGYVAAKCEDRTSSCRRRYPFCTRKRPAVRTDLFADDDDLTSMGDDEISLEQHTAAVVRAARKMARHCGLPNEFVTALEFAATWHDSGKLDERFQQFLRHGDEIASVGEAIAKSAIVPLSPQQRRAIREAAGLPDAFRHEGLSVQLAESHSRRLPAQAAPLLALHLIASHHGYARPFSRRVLTALRLESWGRSTELPSIFPPPTGLRSHRRIVSTRAWPNVFGS